MTLIWVYTCLPMSQKWNAKGIWVKAKSFSYPLQELCFISKHDRKQKIKLQKKILDARKLQEAACFSSIGS